jgi:hypothetical protein
MVSEDDAAGSTDSSGGATASAGTSATQSGGAGYPAVSKWESGIQRGPSNQVAVTKWADVVGSKLNRGKANQLKEQISTNSQSGTYVPTATTSKYKKPSLTNTNKSNQNNTNLFKGKEKPTPPVPAVTIYRNYQVMDKNGNIKYPYERKNKDGQYLDWYYKSPIGEYGNVGFIDELTSAYRNDLNYWLIANLNTTLNDWERYSNRKSKSGKNVPKGFNPDIYDEYLNMVSTIQKQIDDINSKHKMGYWNKKDLNKVNNLNKQLVDLKSEYSNPNFSYGITKAELNQYEKRKKEINDYFSNKLKLIRLNSISSNTNNFKVDNAFINKNEKKWSTEEITTRNEWRSELKKLDLAFGKDNWTDGVSILGQDFDRIWDNWGWAVQLVGNFAIIAATGGIAGIVESAAGAIGFVVSSGAIRAAAPYVVDASFNALVGTYESSRGKNEEALISFLCAMLPYVSYSADIGKVSVKTAENLANKIAKSNLDDLKSMDMFIRSLNPTERLIFRNTMTLPKNMIKNNFDLSVKEIGKKLGSNNLKIQKPKIKDYVSTFGKQMGFEAGVPFAGAIANAFFKIIKDSNVNFTSDDLIEIKNYINTTMTKLENNRAMYVTDQILKNIDSIDSAKDFIAIAETYKFKEPTQSDIEILNKKHNLKLKFKNKQ